MPVRRAAKPILRYRAPFPAPTIRVQNVTMNTERPPQTASGSPADVSDTLKVKKSTTGFIGSAVALSVGTAVAQAVTILISPILSRLFLPEAFGLAALFTSVAGTVGLAGCLSYQLAIMLPEDDKTAANLFGLCVLLTGGMTLLAALVMAVAGDSLLALMRAEDLAPYKWLVPAGVLIATAALPLRYWNSRHNHFKRLGMASAGASLVNAGATLGAGFAGFTSGLHLILARLPGQATPPAFLGWRFLSADLRFCLRHWTLSGMWQAAKRYKKFPLITNWTALLNMISRQAPVFLIAAFFGPTPVGLYALGRRVLSLPSTLIAQSISQVFFQRGAVKQASGQDLGSLVRNVATRLITVGLLPMLIVGMVGPDLFGFVFGQNWREAGLYASILAIWLFTMFVSSPLSPVLMILERQGLQFILNVLMFVTRVGALVVGGLVIGGAPMALLVFSGVASVGTMVGFATVVYLTRAGFGAILLHLLRQLLCATPTAAIIAVVKWGLGLGPVYVFLAAAVSTLPYVLIALRQDAELRSALRKALLKVVGK